MLAAEYFGNSKANVNYLGMRGRHGDASWMYKRDSTRDVDASEKKETLIWMPNGLAKDTGNPSWRRSLPHALVATISPFLFGYHLGVVNETLENMSLDLGFSGRTMAEGLVVSTCLRGAFIGSMFSGWDADGVGRRRAFQLCALPMIAGASMSAMRKNLWGMLLGRLFVGTGMGIGPPVAALYVTEVSPAYVRGTYGSSTQIATSWNFSRWRICFWASTLPAALLAISVEFCAESPHWLFKRGRRAEAEAESEKLLGGHHVKHSMAELSKSQRGDEADTMRFSELLSARHFEVKILVFGGSALFALQQLSGINAVFYFSSTVFKNAGVPRDSGNICVGIANLFGSIIAMILMDQLGRRALLLGSFFGMAVAMGLQATAATSFVSSSGTLFVLTFSLGAGPVPSLLLSEIFTSRVRAKAMAVCMAVHWVINFLVGLLFLRLLEQFGPLVLYTIFGSFGLLAVIYVKRNVMETKGKTLQEIEIALLPPQ